MKKLFALMLTLCLCLGLAATALAADSDFVVEDGVLIEYTGPGGDVVIPDNVTKIDAFAFADCTGITSITIPAGVTEIGTSRLNSCTDLAEFTVSEDNLVYSSQDGVLFDKDKITLVRFPTGKSGSYAIPDSVTAIGTAAFRNCAGLTGIAIPDSVTKVDRYGFAQCSSLTGVIIPDSVTEIGEWAFSGCTGLTDITIPDGVMEISRCAFAGCTGLTDIMIPDSVVVIWNGAFTGCTGLTDVVIPDGVMFIDISAFAKCTGLTSITIPDSVIKIGNSAFQGCAGLTGVTIPAGVTEIDHFTFADCYSLTDITIPDSVTEIREAAFQNCSNLTVHGVAGSYAETYAGENGIPFVADQAPADVPVVPFVPVGSDSDRIAYPSTQAVEVDGAGVEFQCYALKDENGNDTNYIKLRDLALVLSGTAAQFEVGWDGAVNIETGKAYTPNGSELSTPFSGQREYAPAAAPTNVNGVPAALDAIVLTDDNGGAYTYYKLRDLGAAIGFVVDWSADRGIYIETA